MFAAIVVVYPAPSLMFRLRYRHGERLPATGPVLLVANHVSILDPIACARLVFDQRPAAALPGQGVGVQGLRRATLLRTPARSRSPGSPPTPTARSAAAQADLAAGNVVVIYPEGSVTRDPDWWPMQSRTGVARLALTTDAVVVPVAQWGPQRVHDYHTKKLHLRLRTPADYLVGEPVDLSAQRAAVRAGRPLSAELLRETTDLIMGRVRDQLGELRGRDPRRRVPPPPGASCPATCPGSAA